MGSSKKSKKKGSSTQPIISSPSIIEESDDVDLLDELMAQLDSRGAAQKKVASDGSDKREHEGQGGSEHKSKRLDARGRFQARQARKAIELAESFIGGDLMFEAELRRRAEEEIAEIARTCQDLQLQIHQINPDGHCLFSAIADQLVLLGLLPSEKATHAAIRTKAVEYISSHRDEFIPFLAVPETEVVEGGLMNTNQFEAYCEAMRNTATWGGEPEIFALARAFDLPIHVIQSTKPNIVVHEPEGGSRPGQHPIRVSYHRHQFGLGEHYNSLRPMAVIHKPSES